LTGAEGRDKKKKKKKNRPAGVELTALLAPVLVGILEGFEKGARVRISVGL
jgi:hypothetical protein